MQSEENTGFSPFHTKFSNLSKAEIVICPTFNFCLKMLLIFMAVGDAYVFPGFLTQVLTQLFFPKPPTTFLTCFCRGKRQKYP